MSASSVAVLIKSRAKYGKLLKLKQYSDLLDCNSIQEIVTYLKTNTHYNISLEGLQNSIIHRGNLEMILKRHMYDDFANLYSFERLVGEHYFEYMLLKSEVDQLSLFLRYFLAGKAENFPFNLPSDFRNSSKIDIIALTHAKTFDEILYILKPTRYYKLLIPFKADDNTTLDFTMIESALDNYMYASTRKLIDKYFSGETHEELIKLMCAQAELDNIRKIYRAKKYYNISVDELNSMMNHEHFYLNKQKFNQMLNASSIDEVMEILNSTKYRFLLNKHSYIYIDDFAKRLIYKLCRKKIHFSREPAVVVASAIIQTEIEIYNITNIIEGKRYNVDNETIKKLLILDE